MRDLHLLDAFRIRTPEVLTYYGGPGDHETGVFQVGSCTDNALLKIIASAGCGWEHVSVSRRNRPPNWAEMEQVKRLFFKDGETAMQIHVAQAEHINVHPNCLHLWRPKSGEIPLPPKWMVGKYPGWETDFARDMAAEGEAA